MMPQRTDHPILLKNLPLTLSASSGMDRAREMKSNQLSGFQPIGKTKFRFHRTVKRDGTPRVGTRARYFNKIEPGWLPIGVVGNEKTEVGLTCQEIQAGARLSGDREVLASILH
jgi:hypothetical protein